MNGFIGIVKKFEPLADSTVTVMLSVSGDQIQAVVDAWKASQNGERFYVEREQLSLPGVADNKIGLLKEISSSMKALEKQVEKMFVGVDMGHAEALTEGTDIG